MQDMPEDVAIGLGISINVRRMPKRTDLACFHRRQPVPFRPCVSAASAESDVRYEVHLRDDEEGALCPHGEEKLIVPGVDPAVMNIVEDPAPVGFLSCGLTPRIEQAAGAKIRPVLHVHV